jgi:glucokinase
MLVGAVSSDREVHYRSTEATANRSADEVLEALEDEVRAALAAVPDAAGIGLGVPATIDHERGIAIQTVNLPLVDVPIRDRISQRLGLSTSLDNDANVAALAEHRFGAARGARNAVVLTIGTGIGGGLILGGELYRGSTGAGAELGHVVIEIDGPRCQGNCPNRGCVEALASGTAMGREGREAGSLRPDSALGALVAGKAEIDGRAVTEAALAGDGVARDVVATIGRRLGVALSSFANIFEPEVIVIGGGVSAAGELLVGPAREELRRRALPPQNQTRVTLAELGPDAGMIGAAAMALEEAAAPSAEGAD